VEKGSDAKVRVYQVDHRYKQKIMEQRAVDLSATKGLFAEKTVFSIQVRNCGANPDH
jgi:hypothetical protein